VCIGAGFAGPSIWGTGLPRTGPRSEYYARGDAGTALPLPWLPGVARIVGDGFVDGQPFDACPRQVLHRALARLKAAHGHAVLFDAHSIKSELPWLFEGSLPHMNLGTVGGTSCAPALRDALAGVFAAQSRYTHVVDGRFKGGHITRHFGRPVDGIHAAQLEMCWRAYMDEAPGHAWDESRAAAVRPLLQSLVQAMIDWRPQ
jgi:N-formylglutamate deformylase